MLPQFCFVRSLQFCVFMRTDDGRSDIQSVFDPVFDQILQLVQDQVNTVKALHKQKIQVHTSPPTTPRTVGNCPQSIMSYSPAVMPRRPVI